VAGGVVFYALLALFPALAAFVSIYGLFADPVAIEQHLSLAADILPTATLGLLKEELARLASDPASALRFGFGFGLLIALWSANAGTKAIIDGLNVAYGESEKRGFIRFNLVAFLFTLGVFLAMTLAVSVVVVAPIVLTHVGLSNGADPLVRMLRWPVLFVFTVVGLAVLYRHGPSRLRAPTAWITVGAVAATFGGVAASVLFSWYMANFGGYDAAYGSLGAAIGMMMWMWISTIAILLGAQLDAEIEHQMRLLQ
jgi:membrane protein